MKSTNKIPAHERILTTAHDLFYQHGIRATGIDKIIAQSEVAKVTFYRHFASKNDLVLSFLEYRHQLWISWFKDALKRYGNDIHALVPTLSEWFRTERFRGCAFINTVGELADELPAVIEITRNHKREMIEVVSELIPASVDRETFLSVIAVAIDGAIIHTQYDKTPERALNAIDQIIIAFTTTPDK